MNQTQLYFVGHEKEFSEFIYDKTYSQITLVAEARTNGFCIPVLKKLFPELRKSTLIILPAGEENKSLDSCHLLWQQLTKLNADKQTLLISIGGGMLSDLVGFAASLYKRGLQVALIPTTLLSMVDASHGGKTAVDFEGIKNLIGTFQLPVSIYINPIFLHSLSERILHAGMAEMIKHALIESNSYWDEVKNYSSTDFIQLQAIKKSVEIKLKFTQQDPKDLGIRQALNFGHSIGHAIESATLHSSKPLLHGEAIVLGMDFELQLSHNLLGLEKQVIEEYRQLRKKLFPTLNFTLKSEDILNYILHDKKNDKHIRMSLLQEPGVPAIQTSVSIDDLLHILKNHDSQ